MGRNSFGQLGTGDRASRSSPVVVDAGEVVSIAAGSNHSLFVRYTPKPPGAPPWAPEHQVVAMGRNSSGQLGTGDFADRVLPMGIYWNGVYAAAGGDHSLVVSISSMLLATGGNSSVQLGTGDTIDRNVLSGAAVTGYPKIAAGRDHSLILDGYAPRTLWAVGSNFTGAIGDGAPLSRAAPIQVATHSERPVVGSEFSGQIEGNGVYWAFGANSSGQLGVGDFIDRTYPALVAGNLVLASGGGYHALLLKSDGTLWAAGANWNGQLGTGSTNQQLAP